MAPRSPGSSLAPAVPDDSPSRAPRLLFLALTAVLPLHTVFIRAEIAWKPWLVLLLVVVGMDIWWARGLPWSRRAMIGVGVFLVAALVSWPGPEATASFWRLWLALVAGGLLLLTVTGHALSFDDLLKTVFWSGAVMALTAVVLELLTNGVFGEEAVTMVNRWPLVDRVNKPAYLDSGFIALTNWHQDPAYSALWANVWLLLGVIGWSKGVVHAPRWVGPLVVGGLITTSFLTFSRAGWLGVIVALTAAAVTIWRYGRDRLVAMGSLVMRGGLIAILLIIGLMAIDPDDVGGDIMVAVEYRLANFVDLGDPGEPPGLDLVVADNRAAVWEEYSKRFADRPLRGIGLGTGWGERGLQEPHNMWVELLAETGIIGLAGFIAMLLVLKGGTVTGWAVMSVVGLATLTQTVLFEPVLWLGLGLWSMRSDPLAEIPSGTPGESVATSTTRT